MRCPVCKIRLQRAKYEGVNIRQCEKCKGHLVRRHSLDSIKTRRDKTENDLLHEVVASDTDSDGKLRCGSCLGEMEKRRQQMGSSSFTTDHCKRCKLIWLDAGELAKLQVIYEYSEQGEEAQRFRDRLNNMTPEEKAEFEEAISRLKTETVVSDVVLEILAHCYFGTI